MAERGTGLNQDVFDSIISAGRVPAQQEPESSGFIRRIAGDGILTAVKGAIGVPEAAVGLADIATGGSVGKFLENEGGAVGFRPKEAKAMLDEYYSPEQKAAFAAVQNAANPEDGLGQRILDTGAAAIRNPSTIVHAVGESIPMIGAGGVIGRGVMAMAPKAAGYAAAGIGEGVMAAGSGAEQMRQQTADGYLTGQQSMLAAGSGALTGGLGIIAGKAAKSMGIGDIDTLIVGGAHVPQALQKGFTRKLLEGAFTEGFMEELPQSVQEQVTQNYALGKPLDEGVDQAVVMGLLSGGAMGMGAQVLGGSPKVPEVGPLSRGANLAGGVPPVAPTTPVAPGAAPVSNAPAAPAPAALTPEQEQTLLDHANQRARELNDKANGTKDQTVPGPDGKPMTLAGKPKEFLTTSDKAEQEFLNKAGGDAQALARAYPSLAAELQAQTVEQVPPPASAADLPKPTPEAFAQREEDRPAPQELSKPLDGDILNTQGKPFTTMQGAMTAQKKAGDTHEIVRVARGLVVRQKATNGTSAAVTGMAQGANESASDQPAAGASAALVQPANQPAGNIPGAPVADTSAGPGEPVPLAGGSQAAVTPSGTSATATIDEPAHAAATSPKNELTQPTDGQKKAGNYPKGHASINGLDLSIENPAGSTRSGTDRDGKAWENTLQHHYGYIKGTIGNDKDHVDAFVKPGTPLDHNGIVYVVDQNHPDTGKFDEHKALIGFDNLEDAKTAYQANYAKGWKGMKAISSMTFGNFKAWVKDGPKNTPLVTDTGTSATAAPAQISQSGQDSEQGAQWGRMTSLDRQAVAGRAIKSKLVADKIARTAWADITPKTRARITEAMGAPAAEAPIPEAVAPAAKPKKPAGGKTSRSAAYDKNPMMTFLATHGLFHEKDKPNSQKSEYSKGSAIMVPGYGPVFKRTGKQPSDLVVNAIQEGYLPVDGTVEQLDAMIRRAISGEKISPLYADGVAEQIADQAYADHLAQQQEAAQDDDYDPFESVAELGFTLDDAEVAGYDEAQDPIKLEVNALLAQAQALGIDADTIKENAHYETADQSEQAFYEAARSALQDAITSGSGDGGQDAGTPGNAGEQEGLAATTPEQLKADEERAAAAERSAKAQRAAQDLIDKKERERKDIAKASQAAADTFTLGGDAEQNLSGQQDVFGEPTPTPKPSANTIFTEDAAAAARARLKSKLGRANSGLDPEMMMDGITLAGYHIEKGARSFAAYAKAMVADLGDGVKPFLKSWYMGVKFDPRAVQFDGMDGAAMVESADIELSATEDKKASPNEPATAPSAAPDIVDHVTGKGKTLRGVVRTDLSFSQAKAIDKFTFKKNGGYFIREAHLDALNAAQPPEAPAAKPDNSAANSVLADVLDKAIRDGNMPKDNPALKKLVEAFDLQPATPVRMKQAQELLETAIVRAARGVVAKKDGQKSTFDALVRLYASQPLLNIRSSTSIENQAYSTPAPLAYVASELAGISEKTTVLEPTAGNGMLVIGAKAWNTQANEINDDRVASLRSQGFSPTQNDAAQGFPGVDGTVDTVITNPPFGPIKDAQGNSIKVRVDGYTLGQIDHLIAARALQAMKDDGRATLIIGANKVTGEQSNNDLIFFNWLYGNYNVISHFEVDGDLYQRQGAAWPVRVITIQGRNKTSTTAPSPSTIQRANTWSEVYEQFQHGMGAKRSTASTGASTVSSSSGENGNDARPLPLASGVKTGPADSGKSTGSTASYGDVTGTSARNVRDSAKPAADSVGNGNRAERQSDAGTGESVGGKRDAGAAAATKPDGNSGTSALADAENQFQAKYVPRSARKDEGVLIPVNMAGPTQDALNRLEDAVGDIDEFARVELGYKSVDELHEAFMGLQVDSVASAIHQIKGGKGVIIADQTGIGKGRQAAAIIRWAAKNGKVPIFVTDKPSLFTDMYGDLHDIGTDDIAPFILNKDESIKGAGDERLFANRPGVHTAIMTKMANMGELPQGRNALFMTYSQINKDNIQRKAVLSLAPNAVFILDESHNAGGDSGTGGFIRDALGLASGVTYLSATYAKRPDNMPVYFKTDIGDAVADDATLMSAMDSGGLPLQTVVSNNLVKAGQMFRRERSYDGVEIVSRADTVHHDEHVKLSNETTLALRSIVRADRVFHEFYVKALQKELEQNGSRVLDIAGNQAQQSVDHTQFSSVVHNFVSQMLLGLKAQEAADEAIRSLKRGEKPLIAVENTMGSFLNEYAKANQIKQGDELGSFDYRTVLSRALERSRYIVRQLPNGDKVKEYIPLNRLDPDSKAAHQEAQKIIDSLNIDIPVSPIDWMRNEITKAGFSVAEITGRNLSVDYSDPARPRLSQIDATEQKDKVQTTRKFNSGTLDAIILNVAGSTGISLHASEKFTDQKQRHMIVAQAAKDINIFMQMLGRIHRTGQVVLPKYTILNADLPAEIRPTAILSGKMKSLNANTSSNTESATSVKSADMLNKYGDKIVGQYLIDNPELANAMGIDPPSEKGEGAEDIARKATGRLALMPVKVQEQFYAEVEEQYQALIEYLNKTNQNDLEPRTFDFDARETKSALLFDGPNKNSPFGEDAVYGEYSVKAQGKAMTPDEIRAVMSEHLGGKTPERHVIDMTDDLTRKFTKYQASLPEGPQKDGSGRTLGMGQEFAQSHRIGRMFRVEINGEHYNAVVINLRNTHKATGNPFSLSKFQVTIAVNGALRSVTVPASQFNQIETSGMSGYGQSVDQLFKVGPPNERETAKIVTGNLLGAYGELDGSRGSIITFTKSDGTTEQGILMPKVFNFAKDVRQDYRLKTADDALKFLINSTNENIEKFGINSRDGVVRIMPEGSNAVVIQVPKSRAKGGKFFLDKKLLAFTGDFTSQGNFMRATVRGREAVAAIDVLLQKQALYALPSMAEEAREILGDTLPPDANPAFSRGTSATQAALKTLSENDELFALPKSDKDTVEGIAADNLPSISVRKANHPGLVTTYFLTMPDGNRAKLMVRKVNPYGPQKYGELDHDDGNVEPITERPGDNAESVSDDIENVYIDVSALNEGGQGRLIYNIAATFAHNTGRILIGDPAGLSDVAMRRRTEHMLSSALKFGTTRHIAPHPRQLMGARDIGVPPLRWTYGDDLGNIKALIQTSLKSFEYAVPNPIVFDSKTGAFRDSAGGVLDDGAIQSLVKSGRSDASSAGVATYKRSAVLSALVREEGSQSRAGGQGAGILAQLLDVGRQFPVASKGIFYSKGNGASATGLSRQSVQDITDAIKNRWGNAPQIVVAANMADPQIPQSVRDYDQKQKSLGATGEPEGFVYGGKVYLLADQLATPAEVMRVLFHESLGHMGLRGVFGDKLDGILKQLAGLRRADVAAKAAQYGLDMSVEADRLHAAEEVLAELAQTKPELGYVKRAISLIRGWLRANVPGFGGMKLTDADIVAQFITPARRFIEGKGGPKGGKKVQPSGTSATQPAFSRSLGAALNAGMNNVRDVKLAAGYQISDLFTGEGRLSYWHKSVGTMYNLAQRNAPFKKVFDSVQSFLNDVSFYAAESADLAPSILPKLDKIGDVLKSPLSPEDTKALSAPVFEGTLTWGRDSTGKAVPMEEIEAELALVPLDDRAHKLVKERKLDPKVLKMWQGLQQDQYEAIINGKFEREFMRAGVVFTIEELKQHFGMTDAQVGLYQEFRAATDKSIDTLAISEMLNYADKDVADIRDQIIGMDDVEEAGQTLRDYLVSLTALEPGRDEVLSATAAKMLDIAAHAKDMKERGYAPLSRFGNFTLEATLPTGERYFSLFETDRERNKMLRILTAEGATDVQAGTMSQEAYKLLNGVSPETAALFGEMLGLDSQGNAAKDLAFQEFIKRGTANRSAMKRLLKRKGIAGFSEDSGRVLAGFIYSNARKTSSNLHSKETTSAVDAIPKQQGELKDVAVKLQEYVSSPQEEAQAFRGILFAQYLGGSVASAMVNATQPFTVTLPYLSQFGGIRKAAAQMAAAVRDANKDKTGDVRLDAALKKAEEDGIVSPQEVHALQAQAAGRAQLQSGDGTAMGNALAKAGNGLSKLSLAWGKVFGFAEQFNRRTTFIAAYRTAVEQGHTNPAAFAEKAVSETQFVYNKGNKPRWARGVAGSILFTFKQYSVNYLELVTRMATAGEPGSAERAAGQKAAVLAIAILFMMAGADGLPFVEDIQDVLDGALQRLGYNFSSKQAMKSFLAMQLGKDGAAFVMNGVSGVPGIPIDVSGRLGMGNLIPGTGLFQKKTDHTRDLMELAGPGGDFVKRGFVATEQALAGDVTKAMGTISPVASRNVIKALDMADTGMYRDDKGRKIIETTGAEAFLKGIGFQPRNVKEVQDASGEVQRAKSQYILASSEIRAKMAQAIFVNDNDLKQAARDDITTWNTNNPGQRMTLNMPAVLRRVREMRKSKEQRMADTAPKAIRAQVREQLRDNLQ